MAQPKVVITNKPFQETIAFLEPHCNVVVNSNVEIWSKSKMMAELRDATAMMAFMPDVVDESFLDACPSLKMISCALKGYDNFDQNACARRGISITFVPDLLTKPTAELAVGLTIALARNMRAGDRHVRSNGHRGWRAHLYGKGLCDSTVGVLGFGAVGRATAIRLSGFGCQILYYDRAPLSAQEEQNFSAVQTNLDNLLESSDFILVCLPLNTTTRHLVDAERIEQMKPGSFLVNISRGSVVNEKAVADALDNGHLAGYAADVFEFEDLALVDRSREIDARLLTPDAPTVFTPHIGSAVNSVRREIELQAARNIVQFLRGEIPEGVILEPVT